MGTSIHQNRISAVPPSATKAGAPIATATASTTSAGTNSRVDAWGTASASNPITAANAAAADRPRQRSDARYSSRTAITAKPAGSASSMAHTGMP